MNTNEAINLGTYRRNREDIEISDRDEVVHAALRGVQRLGIKTQEELEIFFDQPHNDLGSLVSSLGMTRDDFLELGIRALKREGATIEAIIPDSDYEAEGEANAVSLLNDFIDRLNNIINSMASSDRKVIDIESAKYRKLLKQLNNLKDRLQNLQRQQKITVDQEKEFGKRLIAKVIVDGGIENLDYDKQILPLAKQIFKIDFDSSIV